MKKLLILLLFVLLYFACETTKIEDTPDIMPLEIGNTWVYEYHFFGYVDTLIYYVDHKSEIDGKSYYCIKTPQDTMCVYTRCTSAGLYMIDRAGTPYLSIPNNAQIGDTLKFKNENYYNRDPFVCNAQNLDISVPAGTWQCESYISEHEPESPYEEYDVIYYSNGLGKVKEVYFDHSLVDSVVLVNYTIN